VSSGVVHFRINLAVDFVAIPVGYLMVGDPLATALAIGCVVGTFATPDVRDLEQKTYPVYVLSRIPLVGRLVAWVFRIFWAPLAIALPHRSRLSHMPVIGTLVAAFYSLGVLSLFLAFLSCPVSPSQVASSFGEVIASPTVHAVFVGWAIQDISHWVADGRPRRRKQKPQRFSKARW
jgi:uncharacterized metal-binding protein